MTFTFGEQKNLILSKLDGESVVAQLLEKQKSTSLS